MVILYILCLVKMQLALGQPIILGPHLFSSLLYLYLNEFKTKNDEIVEAPREENMEHGYKESGSLDDTSRRYKEQQ